MLHLPVRLGVRPSVAAAAVVLLCPLPMVAQGLPAAGVAGRVIAEVASAEGPSPERGGESAQGIRRRLTRCKEPMIGTQPHGVTIAFGETAQLSVEVRGTEPLVYRWYLGDVGDTSARVGTSSPSFTTPVLTVTARYWVLISNECGEVSSEVAVVTVTGEPEREMTVFLGTGDAVPLVLVRVSGGTQFMMGAGPLEYYSPYDRIQHSVTVAHDYYVGKTEVTQAQWRAVMGTDPSYFSSCGDTCPVEQVSWNDVAGPDGFIDRLNRAQGTTRFRLPTEAEWEYAARAGTTTEFSFPVPFGWNTGCERWWGEPGLAFPAAEPYMWWCGNSEWTTHPVGQKLANPWGLLDIHGNVWEWVQDWWHDTYEGAPADGSAWLVPSGSMRVLRGGSWFHSRAFRCRSAQRLANLPDDASYTVGFRLAASP